MAIGSDPEIGVAFTRWGDMSEDAKKKWFLHMQETYGSDLMGGYARVIYIDRSVEGWASSYGVEVSEMVEEPFTE